MPILILPETEGVDLFISNRPITGQIGHDTAMLVNTRQAPKEQGA